MCRSYVCISDLHACVSVCVSVSTAVYIVAVIWGRERGKGRSIFKAPRCWLGQEEDHRRMEELARQKEEEVRQKAAAEAKVAAEEKLAKKAAEEEAKVKAEAEAAFAIIGDLDNALKVGGGGFEGIWVFDLRPHVHR